MTMVLPKQARLKEVFRRLGESPSVSTHEGAKRLIDMTLNEVEDELSGVPFNPAAWRTDGRMYPAQEDSAADVAGHPGVTSYRSRGHETWIRDNGAIEIRDTAGRVCFRKPGADGRGVWS